MCVKFQLSVSERY